MWKSAGVMTLAATVTSPIGDKWLSWHRHPSPSLTSDPLYFVLCTASLFKYPSSLPQSDLDYQTPPPFFFSIFNVHSFTLSLPCAPFTHAHICARACTHARRGQPPHARPTIRTKIPVCIWNWWWIQTREITLCHRRPDGNKRTQEWREWGRG